MTTTFVSSTLEEMCELVVDCPHFTPEWTKSGFVVVRNQNIRNGRLNLDDRRYTHEKDFLRRTKRAKPRAGDIIFTREAPMGEVCLVPEGLECCLGQRQVLLRPRPELSGGYLFYALQSPYVQQQVSWNEGTGSTVSNVRIPVLKALDIPRRSNEEGIAALLRALDDKIELNRRMNETLVAMARAIFKDWFVDFGPTQAKLEGRAPYLSADRWDQFPDSIDDENTPAGWSLNTLARLAATNSESWTARQHPPTVEYVDLSSTKWGNIEATSLLDWESAPSRARRIAKTGDTIVGTTRPGNGSFAYISRDGLTVSTGFAVLSPRKKMYRDYVYIAATRVENIERLANLADGHGGAYPAVKPNEVADTVIVFPGDEVLASFADFVSPIREKIEHAKAESRTLALTRDLLLPRLMSGEIRLPEAENVVEAVI